MLQVLLTLGFGVLLYGLGYQFGAWRARREAHTFVDQARTRLAQADRLHSRATALCHRTEQLLAKAKVMP